MPLQILVNLAELEQHSVVDSSESTLKRTPLADRDKNLLSFVLQKISRNIAI